MTPSKPGVLPSGFRCFRRGPPPALSWRVRALPRSRRSFARPEQQQLARLARQLAERHRQIDAEVAAERLQRLAHELAVAARPRRDGAVGERLRFVRHDALRIEIHHRAQPLTIRAGAVRRVERKGARRHLRHAQPAIDAGQLAREEPIAAVVRVDDDDVVGQVERDVDRLGEPALDAAAHDHAIDDHLDRVIAAPIELDVLLERAELAVDARLREAAPAQRRQLLLELALAPADDRRQHVDARVLRVEHHHVDDALERLAGDLLPAVRAVRHADVGEEQPQVVVDFGDGADRRPRVRAGGLLLDRDGGRQAVDEIDVRLLHLLEELARVGRERLDIAPLALGVNRVEGERRLARARQAGDDHQPVPRNVDVDVLEVVDAGAAHRDPVVRHRTVRIRPGGFREPQNNHGSTRRRLTHNAGLHAERPLPNKSLDAILRESDAPQHQLKRTLGAFDVVMLGIGAIIGAGIFATIGTAAAGDATRPGSRPGAHPLLRRHRRGLRIRGALLRRVRGDGADLRQRLHLFLRDARRARRVDHRLGPDHRVRGRQRRRGHQLGQLLQDVRLGLRHRHPRLAVDRLPHGGAHPRALCERAAPVRRAHRLQHPRHRHRRR